MVRTSVSKLNVICATSKTPRLRRRVNGLQFPLHPQQLIGWLVIVITSLITFTLIVPSQAQPLRDVAGLVFLILYLLHVATHAAAVLLDPAEQELRKLSRFAVPEFDRNVHAHVIENGRCHLCNIQTSSKHTKHCSTCNKCVAGFDHHCKWLNHCIGRRNYIPFFLSVTTAILATAATVAVCLCDVAFYFVSPEMLSYRDVHLFQFNQMNFTEYDPSGWTFICVVSIFGSTNLIISCVLIHLCSFHIYISILGLSTYEYIMGSYEPEGDYTIDETQGFSPPLRCCSKNIPSDKINHSSILCKVKKWHKNKVGNTIKTVSGNVYNGASNLGNIEGTNGSPTREVRGIIHNSTINEGSNVTNLMAIIMNSVNSKNEFLTLRRKQVSPIAESRIEGGMTILPSNILEETEDASAAKHEIVQSKNCNDG